METRNSGLVRRPSSPLRGLFPGGQLPDFLGLSPFIRSLDTDMDNLFNNTLPSYQKTADGYEYMFNLAGFKDDEISIKVDPKSKHIRVSAEQRDRDNARVADYSLSLINEGSIKAENISTSYENGMLTIAVKDSEPTNSAFEISLNSSRQTDGGSPELTDASASSGEAEASQT
jgi:HSP20 family molecular chaperone IbpA